jgi:uncharacterized RDD family membrane protein YckC
MSEPSVPQAGGESLASAASPVLPLPAAESLLPGREDLLGLRIAAALIDLAVLAGLLVILSAAVGQAGVSGGGFSVSVSGAWAAVFLAVALLYYFALEAWIGQTLGKRLLGLRVLGVEETRPSVRAVAVRTLLRIVDWLPLLYLAGFITTLATGTRRQRIGDLVGHTEVARALPVRHRGLALVPLAVVLLAAVGLLVYRSASAGRTLTDRVGGVSFDYPAGWGNESAPTDIHSSGVAKLWSTAVGPGTHYDVILVEAFRVNPPVTAANLGAFTPGLQAEIQQGTARAGGGVQAGPEKITMAGMPGLRFRVTGITHGSHYTSILVFAFNGTTEYFVNCQYTSARAAEVTSACDQVVDSFHLGQAATAQTKPQAPHQVSGPNNGNSFNGNLGAVVVPAPSGFALSQDPSEHSGPMNAAGFNSYMGSGNLAAGLHFVRGYDVFYDNPDGDIIEVTLFQFATQNDASDFAANWLPGEPLTSKPDPVIPGATDYDSTTVDQGSADHGVIAIKGNVAFMIDDVTSTTAPVPLVETMARQQYATL